MLGETIDKSKHDTRIHVLNVMQIFKYTLQLGIQHRWPLSILETSHTTGLRVAFPTEME